MSLDLLSGIRVIDLTSIVSGPYATLLLADFGADVVKVEPPRGDTSRDLGPRLNDDMGAVFLNANRNKRSVIIDLSTEEGRAVLRRLCADADVFVHNLRPDAELRCGADAASLRAGNPRLVHCVVRGFASNGPLSDLPAYDDVIQAAAGIAGAQEWLAGEPTYVASAIADKITSLFCAFSVAAALAGRARTGEGVSIEVPMFENLAGFMLIEHLWGRTFVPARGEARYPRVSTKARKPFRTADGYISAVVYTNDHWARFFALIGRPELAAEERFASLGARTGHLEELYELVEAELAKDTSAAWIEALRTAGIPAGPYRRIADLFDDPQLAASGFFEEVEHPSEGRLLQYGTPITVDGRRPGVGAPAPRLGEHTDAILSELDDQPATS